MFELLIPALIIVQSPPPPPPPTITIDRDNIEIAESCVVQVGANPIVDSDNNGVIHVTGDGITVDFENELLCGAIRDQTPDTFTGIGIRLTGKKTAIWNARVSGYKVGIHANQADGSWIRQCTVTNNFRQRLKSTPAAEDSSDWLWPHANDNYEWINKYGAGIYIERTNEFMAFNNVIRSTQNGIILDRVTRASLAENDCSFLSGWGVALWRSSGNSISRNALDFCVRGYSHGVYNRGQDSAGILMFEQCSNNVISENSVTHGGDGLFAFAGQEALGQMNPRETMEWYRRRGCNENVINANDFSYAAAHGLELTFSFDNHVRGNRFVENAICGIWGGYSQRTFIAENVFVRNGEMAYGLERGGINIEHGSGNLIGENQFVGNKCGIHLWWDDDADLLKAPWARFNGAACEENAIFKNTFRANDVAIQLRMADRTRLVENHVDPAQGDLVADEHSLRTVFHEMPAQIPPAKREVAGVGRNHMLGARANLAGRENIIMTEWGPWDHESPLLRFEQWFDHAHEYRLIGAKHMPAAADIQTEGEIEADVDDNLIRIRPKQDNTLVPYSFSFDADSQRVSANSTLSTGTWEVWTFKSVCDPREDVERWRREGTAEHHTLTADTVDFRFGSGGMSDARHLPVPLPGEHFGVMATRSLTIPAGKWRIKTTSDDGIRVWMDQQLVIDDWTWHGPTRHDHEFEVKEPREHKFRVEYFELDGYAVLGVEFEKVENR